MAIKPTNRVRTRLRLEQPDCYAEYTRRKNDVVAQYGLRPELPAAEHANQGKRPSEKYIMLRGLLAIGKELGWHDIDAFEKGMRSTAANSDEAARVHASFENLSQGDRNALVRMGALLQLLEQVLNKGVLMNPATLLSGTTLNISEVASRVEEIICDSAKKVKVPNFGKEANRKQFTDARQWLKTSL